MPPTNCPKCSHPMSAHKAQHAGGLKVVVKCTVAGCKECG